MAATPQRFLASRSSGEVSALLELPPAARSLFVLAHGAGAGMRHSFLEAMAERLAERDVGTLRYQFPYLEAGRRRPDPPPILEATVMSAVAHAAAAAPGLPLVAGGKSMGGRMSSRAAARRELPGVRGLVFLGFPLHPPGRASVERAEHLDAVRLPMLCLQGTRDRLAELALLEPLLDRLGPRAALHKVETADHGFHVLKRSGRTDEEALDELADRIRTWVESEILR